MRSSLCFVGVQVSKQLQDIIGVDGECLHICARHIGHGGKVLSHKCKAELVIQNGSLGMWVAV